MKNNLQLAIMAFALSFATVNAQNGRVVGTKSPLQTQSINGHSHDQKSAPGQLQRCSTGDPGAEWDAWFNAKVEQFKKDQATSKNNMPNYTIPVVVHVIHSGEAVGSGRNISQAQVIDQINILNADFAGTGLNSGSTPSVWSSTKANCQVSFCLATKNPSGVTLTEPGIDRRHYNTISGLAAPGSGYTQTVIDNTIKPNTIWDPTRYCNMWVLQLGSSLLGYATFPAGTGLTGLSGPFGTTNTDGVVMGYNFFGSIGAAAGSSPYHKGRTTTHEVGHWLGLRHITGDATCGNDFCTDTPTQDQLHFGCFTYPYHTTQCSGNTTNGEMFMNFMDYTDDLCMYMFTNDQKTRIQTAMANGTHRMLLTTSAGTLCTLSAATPTSNFNLATTGCAGTPVTPSNNSLGTPAPTYTWSSTPATGVTYNPNNNATNPAITFANAGTYTVQCAASNSLGTNSSTKVITITSCTSFTTCLDTITTFAVVDTMNVGIAGSDTGTPGCSPKAGYIFGSNCYDDMEKAEYFAVSTYSQVPSARITAAMVLFYKDGTKGTGGNASTPVNLKLYTGTLAGGPTGTTTPIGTATANIGLITSGAGVNGVGYVGNPSLAFTNPIIRVFKYNFTTPVVAPTTNGFFASVVVPTAAGDSAVIMDNRNPAAGTAWELWNDNTWHSISTAWTGIGPNGLAICPIMTCPTDVKSQGVLESSIGIMPNPTSGLITVAAALPSTMDINITVTNTLGQIISETNFTNVTNNAFTVDLSGKDNGVYFVSISNGTEKVVRKVILTK